MSAPLTAVPPALARFGEVSVSLSVELGRAELPLRDVLALGAGSVVPLHRLTDELLDVTANGKLIARGEVVAENGRFGLRIVSLVGEDSAAPAPALTRAPYPAPAHSAPPMATAAPPPPASPPPPPPPPAAPAQPGAPADPLGSALDDIFGSDGAGT